MKELMEIIGREIRQRREAMGLSRRKLAEAVGYHDATSVRYWEIGRNMPSAWSLYCLARVFGCTVDDLMGGAHESAG